MNSQYKFILLLCLLCVAADVVYSFLQYIHLPLDGDMAGGIIPFPEVEKILQHPLGLAALWSEPYPNPNRFFSHWAFYYYFNIMPYVLQVFFHPIESVYIACGLIKTVVHIALLYLMATSISGKAKTVLGEGGTTSSTTYRAHVSDARLSSLYGYYRPLANLYIFLLFANGCALVLPFTLYQPMLTQ